MRLDEIAAHLSPLNRIASCRDPPAEGADGTPPSVGAGLRGGRQKLPSQRAVRLVVGRGRREPEIHRRRRSSDIDAIGETRRRECGVPVVLQDVHEGFGKLVEQRVVKRSLAPCVGYGVGDRAEAGVKPGRTRYRVEIVKSPDRLDRKRRVMDARGGVATIERQPGIGDQSFTKVFASLREPVSPVLVEEWRTLLANEKTNKRTSVANRLGHRR
jgi:hypothetical protein